MLPYRTTGEGPPVLLVMGLGLPGDAWWRTVPVLARTSTVVPFDNRGVGRGPRPAGPLTIASMAADAVSVLDAAEITRAHVYGISMGGMIAQELALAFPDRVGSLVLGATSAGGALATPPDPSTLAFLARRAAMPDEEGRWASVPYVYSDPTRAAGGVRLGGAFAPRRSYVFQPDGYRAQLMAAGGHDTAARVGSISAPTLVIHG